MSLFESRPTLIDSDSELSASVEPCPDEGVVVFLRMREGNAPSMLVKVTAQDFASFANAIAQMANTFEKPPASKEKKASKNKVPVEWGYDLAGN